MTARYYTMNDVRNRYPGRNGDPITRQTVYRWIKVGILPKPISLSKGTMLWPVEVIHAHEAKLAAEQGAPLTGDDVRTAEQEGAA